MKNIYRHWQDFLDFFSDFFSIFFLFFTAWALASSLINQITNRRVIANEFNRYFVSLAPKLNDPDDHCIINIEPIQPFTAFLKQSNISSSYLSECTLMKYPN